MRRKVNESKAIFDEIYNVYKNVKPKCKDYRRNVKRTHLIVYLMRYGVEQLRNSLKRDANIVGQLNT